MRCVCRDDNAMLVLVVCHIHCHCFQRVEGMQLH